MATTDKTAPRSPNEVQTSETPSMNSASEEANLEKSVETENTITEFLTGWQLHTVTLALCISCFLANLEITIVSTALVAITDSLKDFGQSSWIITSYLITYCGFLILWAKFSDILGRRLCMLIAILFFMISSGACGASQTTIQLIVFRAFQGIFASGIVSMTFVILGELTPPEDYGRLAGIISITFAISYVLGPVLGGVIVDGTTWRWVFLINPPAGLVGLLLVFFAMPAGFPYNLSRQGKMPLIPGNLFSRIDFLGTALLLSATVFLVTALQEAGTQYKWSSALVIVFLVLSGILLIAFIAWAKVLNIGTRQQEPVMPWQLMKHRVFMGILLVTFLAGVPFTVAIINIPERFQTVNNLSPGQAGIKLIPFSIFVSVGSALSSVFSSRFKIPPIFVVLLGAVMQTAGTALMSTLPLEIGSNNYGYQVLTGIGIGLNLTVLILLTPNLIRGKDQSVALGALTQFRALGGVIGLAIATNVLNNHLTSHLERVLSPEQLANLLQSAATIAELPPALEGVVRETFREGFNLQMRIMIGFGAAQILAMAVMWEKKPRRIA
ncbi:MAG: hypothetical protein MMC33_006668 [Icmadophila ericetorum]|nr:hypothetical protein [Icmadophila ericetorum]